MIGFQKLVSKEIYINEGIDIMPSDSNYSAVSRHRGHIPSTRARPPVLETVDDRWAADSLSDDEVELGRLEADAGGFEEGELDADAIVVSPAGNSASLVNSGECSMYLRHALLWKANSLLGHPSFW